MSGIRRRYKSKKMGDMKKEMQIAKGCARSTDLNSHCTNARCSACKGCCGQHAGCIVKSYRYIYVSRNSIFDGRNEDGATPHGCVKRPARQMQIVGMNVSGFDTDKQSNIQVLY